jgi:hypothetical protein
MGPPGADAWELAGFPGRVNVAAYLTADQVAAQYRVLVDVLLDAQEHSLTGVGRDELLAAVRERIAAATDAPTAERLTSPEVFDLDARMKALQGWDVVIRWQDKAKTEADFVRTRDRFQLTSEAADLHRWLRRKVDEDAVATSAAAFAPGCSAPATWTGSSPVLASSLTRRPSRSPRSTRYAGRRNRYLVCRSNSPCGAATNSRPCSLPIPLMSQTWRRQRTRTMTTPCSRICRWTTRSLPGQGYLDRERFSRRPAAVSKLATGWAEARCGSTSRQRNAWRSGVCSVRPGFGQVVRSALPHWQGR